MGVVAGVPFVVIDTVQNSDEGVAARAENVIEVAAELFGGDFPGVTRTDGGDAVGEDNSALETIEERIELEAVQIEIIPGQIGKFVLPGGKVSLESEVVDGQTGSGRADPAFREFLMQDQDGNQCGLPIVDMNDFGLPRQISGEVDGALREKNEALGVVGIIDAIFGVKRGAIIKARLIDEVDRHTRAVRGGPDLGTLAMAAQRHCK